MRKRLLSIIVTMMIGLLPIMAQFTTAPAFPGAEGYGRFTTGGRGGSVIHVTNLNDSGTGSLRAAINATGKRIIVFDVSGNIELKSRLSVTNGNVTILGQTAPGDGICLKNWPLVISTNNVIVRYIRCRMGDLAGNEEDAMSASHHDNAICNNIIIDHCSVSWSVDECGSFYGNKDFTLQWCMFSESLRNSVHDKGNHGYGGIWGGEKASFHHNMLAHHDSRNPRFDHDYVSTLKGPIDYVNNVVYNWGGNSTYGGESNAGSTSKLINMRNNYYKAGPASGNKKLFLNPTTNCGNCTGTDVGGKFFIDGNFLYGQSLFNSDNLQSGYYFFDSGMNFSSWKSKYASATKPYTTDEKKFQYKLVHLQSAQNAFQKICDWVGCSYIRDYVDTRIVDEAINGYYTYEGSNGSKNGLIDTQDDVNGWPSLRTYDKKTDTDRDGMPDAWETANGLNPNDASDASSYTIDKKKWYTNIEVYANSLVEEDVKDMLSDATEGFDEYYPEFKDEDNITHNEGSADRLYDNEPDPSGAPEGYTFVEIAQGTVTWTVTSSTSATTFGKNPTVSNEIADYVTCADAVKGSKLTGGARNTYSSGPNGSQNLLRFDCSTKTTAPEDGNSVVFAVSPNDGYYFKPTKIETYVNKVGTDGGDATVTIGNDKASEVAFTGSPSRNSVDASKSYNNYTYVNFTPLKPIASGEATKATVSIYNYNGKDSSSSKQMSIGTCTITGTLYKLVSTQVDNVSAAKAPVSGIRYNISGQPVGNDYNGVIIIDGKKYNNK